LGEQRRAAERNRRQFHQEVGQSHARRLSEIQNAKCKIRNERPTDTGASRPGIFNF
jgi:hypothetical protein